MMISKHWDLEIMNTEQFAEWNAGIAMQSAPCWTVMLCIYT